MMISFNLIKPFNKINHIKVYKNSFNFCGAELGEDTFEKAPTEKRTIRVYNPYSNSFCNDELCIDLSKPQIFELKNNERAAYKDKSITVDYNPDRVDYLWDKVNQKPLKTAILFSKITEGSYAFNFMSEKLDSSYGYVYITRLKNPEICFYYGYRDELTRDWINEEIFGDRILVNYLKNFDDKNVGGIGKLADKMIVKFCMDNKIPTNIVSDADPGSHVAHYLRGKRFFELDKDSFGYDFFMKKYGSNNVNKILEELINESKISGKPVNLEGWGTAAMYMPKELAEKYMEELKQYPIP